MTRSHENCGWAPPRKDAVAVYCARRKSFIGGHQPISAVCPCRHWIRRLRIDRLKGKRK